MADAEEGARSEGKSDGKFKVLQGMRVRDEFLCPITFELMWDPVVAADGHSYERFGNVIFFFD